MNLTILAAMNFWEYVFWISCFIVFYNYAGYAIIVLIANKLKRKVNKDVSRYYYPTVSFIVAAYNEEDCIEKKAENSIELNYPKEKIEFIFITDGSTDGTNDRLLKYPQIKVLYSPERRGKSAALNRAVQEAKNDILIFSDANTILNQNACVNISRHYYFKETGGVAGEKKVIASNKNEVGEGEGLYWKYESLLKKLDSDFYSVVGAAGELFSLRRKLYEPVPENVILDDFLISMKVAEKGYQIVYEPDAYAMELPSFSLKDERKRKVRIAAGGFQAMGMLRGSLKFWKNFRLSFLYISHRVLRWTLSPLCLILALVANLFLVIDSNLLLYKVLLGMQLFFYGMGLLAAITGSDFKPFKLSYYFAFMNFSVVLGFFRFLKGKQPATWEKAKRMQAANAE